MRHHALAAAKLDVTRGAATGSSSYCPDGPSLRRAKVDVRFDRWAVFDSYAFRHVIRSAKGLAVRKSSPTINRRALCGLAGLADRSEASSVVAPDIGVDPVHHGLNRLPRISPRPGGKGFSE